MTRTLPTPLARIDPAVTDFLAVEAFRDALPARRQGWFASLRDQDQLRLAQAFPHVRIVEAG